MVEKWKTESNEQPSEELIRKLSKTVLHTSERGRRSLFQTLTAANAERIAALSEKKPIFYEDRDSSPQQLLLDPEIASALSEEFYKNPTQWIEQQSDIDRGHAEGSLPTGETIKELWRKPYDVSKVKEFEVELKDKKIIEIVSKRIRPDQLAEVARAQRALEMGIPTPKIFGEILDHGNAYAWFEHLPGINLLAAEERLYEKGDLAAKINSIALSETFLQLEGALAKLPALSREGRDRIHRLWRRNRHVIVQRESFSLLQSIQEKFGVAGPESDAKQSLHEFIDYINISHVFREGVQEALASIGYDNLESCVYDVQKAQKDWPRLPQKEKVDDKMKRIMESIARLEEKFRKVIVEDIFGFDYFEERRRLQDLCIKKGVEHKDLNERNLLVLWDFKKNRPLPRSQNDPKLYILDWESPSSNQSRPKPA